MARTPPAVPNAPARHRGRAAATRLVTRLSKTLERAPLDEGQKGAQRHFLSRLWRVPDERARKLALRLHYDHVLARFVARTAAGLRTDVVGWEKGPGRGEPQRAIVSLERGPHPARAVVDSDGQVITCLASDMAVLGDNQLAFEDVAPTLKRYEHWRALHRTAREVANEVDLFRLLREVREAGWLAPRETVEVFRNLGPAGGVLLLHEMGIGLERALEAYAVAAIASGIRTDEPIREWLRLSGSVAASMAALAENGVEPHPGHLRLTLSFHDALLPMVTGACLARWRPGDGEAILLPGEPPGNGREDDADGMAAALRTEPDGFASSCALATYFGVLRRRVLTLDDADRYLPDVDAGLDGLLDECDREIRELTVLREPVPVEVSFLRDLVLLAQGRKPDWGPEWPDDPALLPPIRIEDLCAPGGVTIDAAYRNLARRLLGPSWNDLTTLFSTRAQRRSWAQRLGPLDRTRTGTFRLPFVTIDPPRRAASEPGRNDPCPCGSGKKYKRCCLGKPEGPA